MPNGFSSQNRPRVRMLGPRVVLYVIVLLSAAWVMWRYDKNRSAESRTAVVASQPAADAAISSAADGASRTALPMLVLVAGPDNDLDDLLNDLRKELFEHCEATLTSAKDATSAATLREVFQLEELPAAILYDTENHEIGRVAAPLTIPKIRSLGQW